MPQCLCLCGHARSAFAVFRQRFDNEIRWVLVQAAVLIPTKRFMLERPCGKLSEDEMLLASLVCNVPPACRLLQVRAPRPSYFQHSTRLYLSGTILVLVCSCRISSSLYKTCKGSFCQLYDHSASLARCHAPDQGSHEARHLN